MMLCLLPRKPLPFVARTGQFTSMIQFYEAQEDMLTLLSPAIHSRHRNAKNQELLYKKENNEFTMENTVI